MIRLILFFASIILCTSSFSQGAFNERIIKKDDDGIDAKFVTGSSVDFTGITSFGLYGIGNINTEVFNSLNASGKVSGYVRPYRGKKEFVTVNFAFNKNATNSDTLLASTFIFPDVGNNSFLSTLMYSKQFFGNEAAGIHLISPFYEFSTKNINRENDSIQLRFTTINHVIGARYSFMHRVQNDNITFSVATFLAFNNIADQDNKDFRSIFESEKLPSSINSLGFKVAFQFNNFQAYADLRHILGDEEKIPVRSLRGFNSNIGVVFNAEIFER
jgi:hypothetical protein